ncbi:MAG TPA: tetratricopeptide repeat protein [Steroidobacter sp.]|uniref:tetratricopeptide repeat protein n=1 Tax=Steroidobacter sp. TaxID=1978227 RepID=UPI002EDA289F
MRSLHYLQTDQHVPRAAWLALLLPALPALAIIALWWPALPASFQFDDWNVIVNEPRVHSLAAWWQSMPGIRPLLKLSYALNMTLDASPTGFRVVNVLIHAINAILVASLLRTRGIRSGLVEADASAAALLAALFFALHPVQTEAVTYISGRSSSLAACFCLLSLYCWVRSEQSERSRPASGWLAACCLCFILAVATKEFAAVLPFALLLYSADRSFPATLRRLTPPLLLMVLMLCIALSLPTYRRLLAVSLDTRSIAENLLTQAHGVLYLAGQLARPWNGNADPQFAVVPMNWLSASLCVAWLAILAIALSRVRRAPVGAFAVLWFLLWLAPTNSLLPRLDVANDRQLYLALAGPAWWLATRLIAWHRARSVPIAAIIALLLTTLAWFTYQRNLVYDTEITFWQDTAERNPDNSRAANNLGMAYAIDCRFDEAAEAFKRAIASSPDEYHARINLALLRQGQLPGVDLQHCARRAHQH